MKKATIVLSSGLAHLVLNWTLGFWFAYSVISRSPVDASLTPSETCLSCVLAVLRFPLQTFGIASRFQAISLPLVFIPIILNSALWGFAALGVVMLIKKLNTREIAEQKN